MSRFNKLYENVLEETMGSKFEKFILADTSKEQAGGKMKAVVVVVLKNISQPNWQTRAQMIKLIRLDFPDIKIQSPSSEIMDKGMNIDTLHWAIGDIEMKEYKEWKIVYVSIPDNFESDKDENKVFKLLKTEKLYESIVVESDEGKSMEEVLGKLDKDYN